MAGGWDHVLRANPVPGDVVACLDELGLSVSKVENYEAQAPCPAHYERTGKANSRGDWSCNTEDGMHNCFSCGFRGTFMDLVIEVLKCSREEATSWIRARGGIERVRKVLGKGSYIDELVPDEVQESDLALFVEVPPDVCKTRRIKPWAADDYRVLWDTERRLWITQIREYETDRLIGWQEKNKRFFNNHPEHMEKGLHVFGINDVPEDCYTGVVVESPLDCPHILSAGVVGAVATMGSNVTEAQLDILCNRFEALVFAMDDDESGDESSADMRSRIGGRTLLRFWNYGRCGAKDPGDQSFEQIRASYETAYSAVLARF